MSKRLIEKYVPVVNMDGLNTNKDVTIGVNGVAANLNVSGNLIVDGSINFAATTFDDPVTFEDAVNFENGSVLTLKQGAAFYTDSGSAFIFSGELTTNSYTYINGTLTINNQIQGNENKVGGYSGATSPNGYFRTYTGVVNANTTIDLQNVSALAGLSVTFIFESVGGGETVDFIGVTKSEGTLSMGAGAGDIFTITFISNGTNWVEINRTAALS